MTEPEEDAGPIASLAELLEEATAEMPGVVRPTEAGATVLSRDGRPFATLRDDVLDVRLDPPVADAALRTSDATVSPRGGAWVRFAPALIDTYAADRVLAWLGYAWRHALD